MPELNYLKLFASYYYHNMGFNITHICPEANIKRDKDRFIKKNPYKSSSNDRTNFEYFRQGFQELESFDWKNAKGIGTVAGFNGLRALDFDGSADAKFIEKVLILLKLPLDYEWVVRSGSQNGFHIIFFCGNFSYAGYKRRLKRYFPNEIYKSKFKCLDYIWYNHLILPPSLHKTGYNYRFEFVDYPLNKPALIDKETHRQLLFELCYQYGGFNIVQHEKIEEKYYDVPIIDFPIIIDKSEYDKFIGSNSPDLNYIVTNQQVQYYKHIAISLDNVYKKEQYKLGISKIVEILRSEFNNLNILEIACGNGYWTKYIASFSKSIHATDINEECISIAKSNMLLKSVTFDIQDALNIKITQQYDAIFGGFIISHIEKEKLQDFFASIHKAIKPHGKVMLIDNRCIPENNMEIDFESSDGNSYQKRISVDGKEYWIVKNFPEYSDLKSMLEKVAYDIEYTKLKYFWVLTYKLK